MTFKDYFLSEMPKPIQLDGEKIKQMYQDGATSSEIGKQLGVNEVTILNRLKAMGVERRAPGGSNKAQLDGEKIRQMYEAGYTLSEIGNQLGVSPQTILRNLKIMGIERRPIGRYNIQLDDEKIRDMYQNGLSAREIGKQLGVSDNTILKRLKAMDVELRPRGGYPFKRGSDLRNPSQMRTRNITGPGNVGGAHQTFHGSPKTVSTNRPGPMRGGSH